jgi:hypothetical protein
MKLEIALEKIHTLCRLAMGHSQLETTMGYLHAEAMSVRSPLETL